MWPPNCGCSSSSTAHQSPPFDPTVLTIGFASSRVRRTNARICWCPTRIASAPSPRTAGRVQVGYAGKAHPHDEEGKRIIEHVFRAREALGSDVPIVYLEDYDMDFRPAF